jgi:deoxyribodipyrimidine photo-lyase
MSSVARGLRQLATALSYRPHRKTSQGQKLFHQRLFSLFIATMPPNGQIKRRVQLGNGVNGAAAPRKRQKTATASPSPDPSLSTDPLRVPHPFYKESEQNGIVLRKFYPHEMSNDRARAYNADELPRPIEVLNNALAETAEHRRRVKVKDAAVHWFKWDLRVHDNRALSQASDMAQRAGVPLIGLYVVSPQDFEAHLTAPIRIDFMLRTLRVLRENLAKLDIPLWVETVEKRRDVPGRVVELMEEWGANHLFANLEYEVDELRREVKLARMFAERGLALHVAHDTCVVPPGPLRSGTGRPYAVYTPWFRSWIRHIQEHLELLELSEAPKPNPPTVRATHGKLFDCPIPDAPESKRLTDEEKKRFRPLWPAGEQEAMKRLDKFCEENVGQYGKNRNIPSTPGTSNLSVHFACGTLSARTAVRTARVETRGSRLGSARLLGGTSTSTSWSIGRTSGKCGLPPRPEHPLTAIQHEQALQARVLQH